MKIFLVTAQYLGTITGSGGLYALELSRELALKRHEVIVLTPLVDSYPEEETVLLEAPLRARTLKKGRVRIKRFRLSDSHLIKNPFEGDKTTEIRRLQEFNEKVLHYLSHQAKSKCIVHLNGHFIIPSLAKELKKFPWFRIVTSIHSLESISEAKKENNPLSKYVLDHIQKREKEAILYSDYVIFWSHALKEEIAWMYPEESKKGNIHVIPLGIPSSFIREEHLSPEKIVLLKEKYKLTDHFIFYHGRIDEPKGLESLILLFPGLIKKLKAFYGKDYQKHSLLIAGLLEEKNRPYYEKLEKLKRSIKDKEIRESIHIFTDSSVTIDKENLYQLASVFVLPLIVSPFGMSLIEAVIKQNPFVVSGVEGILDILNVKSVKAPYKVVAGGAVVEYSNPTSRIENLASALFHVLTHLPLCKKKILQLRKDLINKYSWEKIIGQKLRIYRDLMK